MLHAGGWNELSCRSPSSCAAHVQALTYLGQSGSGRPAYLLFIPGLLERMYVSSGPTRLIQIAISIASMLGATRAVWLGLAPHKPWPYLDYGVENADC